jgi:hypothetical protein
LSKEQLLALLHLLALKEVVHLKEGVQIKYAIEVRKGVVTAHILEKLVKRNMPSDPITKTSPL